MLKKLGKYAIFRAFSMPKILSGLFGFDGIWTEIYGLIVVKLLVDKPILTSYGSNYWWTIGANEIQFCHRRTNTYLTDLHRALAHSLKTRMGRGSIFFARNPARQIWVGGNRYDGFQSEVPWHRCGQSWRTVEADDVGVRELEVWFRSVCYRRQARHSFVQAMWRKRWGMWIPTPQWNAIAEAP